MADDDTDSAVILRNFIIILIVIILAGISYQFFGWTVFIPVTIGIFIVYTVGWVLPLFIRIYNQFLLLKNSSEASLSQVQVGMKMRLDMIEQLLESVKNYTTFERDVFSQIAALRSMVNSGGAGNLIDIDRGSQVMFGRLLAVAENYPDLKSSSAVLYMMDNITRVEQEIANHRYAYNDISRQFNSLVDTIPSNIVARVLGFKKMQYLDFGTSVEAVPSGHL